ncbi:BON domain-containing protein [Granulicella arctica]|uniref:BON domain-containing protein n=1 Tax=Granulicella arctica TaxID=940613 RepID=UPI0021E0AA54|nr:BON domain-containing protein [Granulicella arctica]
MLTKTTGWKVSLAAIALAISAAQITPRAWAEGTQSDSRIQAELTKSLSNAKFKGVQASVQNGVVSLAGTVDVYGAKEDALKRVHKIKAVTAVKDDLQVGGPVIPDEVLQRKLQSDRIGYGTTAFNAISLNVDHGVVTLGGTAYGPMDKDYALADASYTAGVKGVVDNIQVDPVSMFDDKIRLATARSIYGYPTLNKYAIDPAKPIRIVVQNGNVTLVGVVIDKADKEVAGLRANSVPGVFKVTNDLQVANERIQQD